MIIDIDLRLDPLHIKCARSGEDGKVPDPQAPVLPPAGHLK